jgi:uncharacterized membrane protein
MHEKPIRSITKAISWRVLGSVDTFVVSLLVTGHLGAAGSIAVLEVLTKTILFYFHERVWLRVKWGKRKDSSQTKIDWQKPTVQMLGRFQPWHSGHRALFERCLAKTGQVAILVRDCSNTPNNPFDFNEVKRRINENLSEFDGKYEIIRVPNITNITYGREVGYKIENEVFEPQINNISATDIRRSLGLQT